MQQLFTLSFAEVPTAFPNSPSLAKMEGMGDTSEEFRGCTRRKKKANKERVGRDDWGSSMLCKPKEEFHREQGSPR